MSESRKIEQELTINALPEDVWKALTEGEELTRWFPLNATVKPGVGGVIHTAWGEEFAGDTPITVWDPGKHLQTTWQTPNSDKPLVVDFFIEARAGATVVRLVHSGFGRGDKWDEEYDGINRGWKFELRGLRHYLENHKGKDRQVAWARRTYSIDIAEAWRRVMGPEGLGFKGTCEEKEGYRFAFEKDDLAGEVRIMNPPFQFAGTVDAYNNAYMRVLSERCGGPDLLMYVWLSAYGVQRSVLNDLQARWQAMIDRVLN